VEEKEKEENSQKEKEIQKEEVIKTITKIGRKNKNKNYSWKESNSIEERDYSSSSNGMLWQVLYIKIKLLTFK
jgi:hypothetical protein